MFPPKNFGLLRFESWQKSNGLFNGPHFAHAWLTNTTKHTNAALDCEHDTSDLLMSGISVPHILVSL